jgi:hypothetical protein
VLVLKIKRKKPTGPTIQEAVSRKRLFFTVAVTSHEGRGTELQIWFNGQRYPLWSNFTWEVMQGFPVFEDDKHRFTFLLFLSYGKKGD